MPKLRNNKIFNLRKDVVDKRDFKFRSATLTESAILPISMNHTEKMSPVKNQGNLGSCVGFAVTAMKEWQERIEHEAEVEAGKRDNRKDPNWDLSEQWTYYMSKEIDPWPTEEGTSIRYAMRVLNKVGVPVEKAWPYNDAIQGDPKRWATMVARWSLIESYERVETLLDLKEALVDGPVPIGIPCFEEIFYVGPDGIVGYPAEPQYCYGGHAVCFTKDTLIPLLDGSEISLGELFENYKDKKFWVYSYDTENKRVVPGLAHSPRKTGTKQKILKVTLDNGEIIKCTENHPFMTRDGIYIEAKDLRENISLMPLYRRHNKYGYEEIYNVEQDEWNLTHHMSKNYIDYSQFDEKYVIHHNDFNKLNNDPSNLNLMSWNEHTMLHADCTENLIEYAKSEIGRKNSSECMKKNWKNPEFKEKMKIVHKNNGINVTQKRKDLGLPIGFQNMSKEKLQELGSKNGKLNHVFLNTIKSHKKSTETWNQKFDNDPEFKEKVQSTAVKNLSEYNSKLKSGEMILTDKQINARSLNAKKCTYKRWYQDKYSSFEEYIDIKYKQCANNHKVVKIEECGYEDVYDITVDKYHNFALSAGVFVHNCAVGYDDTTRLVKFKNSWSPYWGDNGYGYLPYQYIVDFLWDAWRAKDLSVTSKMLKGAKVLLERLTEE